MNKEELLKKKLDYILHNFESLPLVYRQEIRLALIAVGNEKLLKFIQKNKLKPLLPRRPPRDFEEEMQWFIMPHDEWHGSSDLDIYITIAKSLGIFTVKELLTGKFN